MNTAKYTADFVRNNLISMSKMANCTLPQKKALKQITCGLLENKAPMLNHLSKETEKATTKKQAEKLGKHLGKVDLTKSVNKIVLNKAIEQIKAIAEKEEETVIAYDLTDIAKPCAQKMAGLTKVFDGSKRQKTNGYVLHGVGTKKMLIRLDLHDPDKHTLPETRKNIIEDITDKIKTPTIWAFDRGNDSGELFRYLNQKQKIKFIIRLRKNRQILNKETGEIKKVTELKPGKYRVCIKKSNSQKFDLKNEYLLVINEHLEQKLPIMLLCSINLENKTEEQIVHLYLERWGSTENHYKRIKNLYNLESIRLIKYNRLKNLLALILFVAMLSSWLYYKINQGILGITAYIKLLYTTYLKQRSLTFNQNSFGGFITKILPKNLRFSVGARAPDTRLQTSLFDFFDEKLGVI